MAAAKLHRFTWHVLTLKLLYFWESSESEYMNITFCPGNTHSDIDISPFSQPGLYSVEDSCCLLPVYLDWRCDYYRANLGDMGVYQVAKRLVHVSRCNLREWNKYFYSRNACMISRRWFSTDKPIWYPGPVWRSTRLRCLLCPVRFFVQNFVRSRWKCTASTTYSHFLTRVLASYFSRNCVPSC